MIRENLQDQKFLDKFTLGFDKFKDYLLGKEDGISKTPEWAERITGVPAETIRALAKDYATSKPAALVPAWAPQRTAYGEQYARTAITLQAMTANIGIRGGYAGCMNFGFPLIVHIFPLSKKSASNAAIRMSKFSDAVLLGKDAPSYLIGNDPDAEPPDIKMVYVVGFNFVNQMPNVKKTIEAMKKLEFVVVHEMFMTPTAKFADILLPVNTHFERNDITEPYLKGRYLIYRNKVLDSLHESRSDLEIFTELAKRLGFGHEYNDKTDEEWLRLCVEKINKEYNISVNYEEFKGRGVYKFELKKPYIPFYDQIHNGKPFNTPSGKIEIYSETLAKMDFKKSKYGAYIPPIPKYIETWESINDALANKYPLQMVTPHPRYRTHSIYWNNPWLREVYAQEVTMNPADASARATKNRDLVKVFNDRGAIILPAKLTERIMPGVISVPDGAWFDLDENGVDRAGNPDILSKDEPSPSGAHPYNTVLVEVQKV